MRTDDFKLHDLRLERDGFRARELVALESALHLFEYRLLARRDSGHLQYTLDEFEIFFRSEEGT